MEFVESPGKDQVYFGVRKEPALLEEKKEEPKTVDKTKTSKGEDLKPASDYFEGGNDEDHSNNENDEVASDKKDNDLE